MSLPVVLRPEATKDAAEAIDYFDALRPGLGQAFLIQVQDVLLRISGMPEIHAIVWRNVRAARLAALHLCRLLPCARRPSGGVGRGPWKP
jgi:hypothetical protein